MASEPRGKNWTFTEYNLDRNIFDWEQLGVKYAFWQLEECPRTQRKHYQGYLQCAKLMRFKAVKKLLSDTAHFEVARGTPEENEEYCSKEKSKLDGPWSFGEVTKPGQRSDLMRCIEAVKDGQSVDSLMLNSTTALIYSKGLREVERVSKRMRAIDRFVESELYPWQQQALDLLSEQDDRTVLWVYDSVGNTGKTYLSHHLDFKLNYQSFMGGKYADLAYAIQPDRDGYCIDLARTSEEFCCYQFMESIKNKRVFTTKYESGTKYLQSHKLIVFSNYLPDTSKLSMDRWKILELISTPMGICGTIRSNPKSPFTKTFFRSGGDHARTRTSTPE